MSDRLTVAVAQPPCVPLDVEANIAAHVVAVRSADARLVVFPELSLTGYELDAPALDPASPVMAPLVEACRAAGSTALVGAPVAEGGRRFLAMLAVDGSGATVVYRKVFLGGDEVDAFSPGDGPSAMSIDGWSVGLGICKDTRIPEHIEGVIGLGIDLYVAGLVHLPDEVDELDERAERLCRLGAIPVALSSAAGPAGALHPATAGHSGIWAADGTVVARAGAEPGGIATATVTMRAGR